MRKTLLFLLAAITCSIVYSQSNYYIIDNVKVTGVRMLDATPTERAKEITVFLPDEKEPITYYPEDITGYGLENGRTFISSFIRINGEKRKVFLEELVADDSIKIYYYAGIPKEMFFIKKTGEARKEIRDKGAEFKAYLMGKAAQCKDLKKLNKHRIKLHPSSINRFYEAYTNCNIHLFPRFRMGVKLGIGLNVPKTNDNPLYTYRAGISYLIGLTASIPIDDKLSFNPEILYINHYNNTGAEDAGQKSLSGREKFKQQSLQLPLLFRSSFNQLTGRYIPFIEAGPIVAFNLSGKRQWERTVLDPDLITKKDTDEPDLEKIQFGGAIGIGVEYKLNLKQSLYLGLRYSYSVGNNRKLDIKERLQVCTLNLSYSF